MKETLLKFLRPIPCVMLLFANPLLAANGGSFAPGSPGYENEVVLPEDSLNLQWLIEYATYVSDSLNDFDRALELFEKADRKLSQDDPPGLQLKLYSNWAYANYRKGHYEIADKLYTKALSNEMLSSNLSRKANILNRAGANLQALEVYGRSILYYSEALEIYARLNDKNNLSIIYGNLANTFFMANNIPMAKRMYEKTEEMLLLNNEMEMYAKLLGNKAVLKRYDGDLEGTRDLLLQVLQLNANKKERLEHTIQTGFNLGLTYTDMGKWDSAFYYLNYSRSIYDSLDLAETYAGIYYANMAYCYDKKGDTVQSISLYRQAITHETGISNMRSFYNELASLYAGIGQYDSAYYYKLESAKMADSTYASELHANVELERKHIAFVEEDYRQQLDEAKEKQLLSNVQARNYLLILLVLMLIALIFVLVLYFNRYKLKEKKEHLQNELDFLKSQLNPHFLFNSLNNIYILLDEDKDKASEILLKFSDLMRYQLYDCNDNLIKLNHEVRFLKNYMECELLRYSDKISISHNFESLPENQLSIAPILLQPFLENAFKHTPKNKKNPATIYVYVSVNGKSFEMQVSNPCESDTTSTLPGGIGLKNVKKRLKLLYPHKHELTITNELGFYTINLKLILTDD